ncbi:hypothetical protein GCM10023159_03030 [Brevibacterium yomogidense]
MCAADQVHDLAAVCRAADDTHVPLCIQQGTEPLPHHRLIVDDGDTGRRSRRGRGTTRSRGTIAAGGTIAGQGLVTS